MSEENTWYIVKELSGICQIVPKTESERSDADEVWGPFKTKGEAIAKRVGLIRAGKCQPV